MAKFINTSFSIKKVHAHVQAQPFNMNRERERERERERVASSIFAPCCVVTKDEMLRKFN